MNSLYPSLKRPSFTQNNNSVFHVTTFDASSGEFCSMSTASSNRPCVARLVSLLERTYGSRSRFAPSGSLPERSVLTWEFDEERFL